MWRDDASLLDMLIWARRAAVYASDRSEPEFLADTLVQDATIRCLEVVGEAASRISSDCREQHPEIPWSQSIGMRNRLVHEYGHVDLVEVWRSARDDCPTLAHLPEPLAPPDSQELPDDWQFL